MMKIVTLTLNPTIDVAYEVDQVFHTHKMRAHSESHDPGGGGINVSRVFTRLGGDARTCYLAGGATGAALDGLLDMHGLARTRIDIKGHTRIATSVLERESGREYRFVPPGPTISPEETQACLDQLEHIECDFLVASGSLPPGMPEDFYQRVQATAGKRGIRMVLDTSGAALRMGLAGGGIYLVKPSQGELQQLVGRKLEGVEAISTAASAIVKQGQAEYVAVTMGHEGAVLAGPDGTLFLPAIEIEAKSAVGAGDSFLAAMVYALTAHWSHAEAFRYGIAAGAAAVLTPGTDLCHREDIERLYHMVAKA